MSAVDTAWLRMDRPHNLMVICGVLVFDRRVTRKRLVAVLRERFASFERFRMMPVEAAGGAQWQADPRFSVERQVIAHRLPGTRNAARPREGAAGDAGRVAGGAAAQRALARHVAALLHEPLPADRPAWQFQLVDDGGGRSALVLRIHHSYADGIALVRVMLAMTDAAADGPPAMPFSAAPRKPGRGRASALPQVLETAMRIGGAIVDKSVEIWTNPLEAVKLADEGSAFTGEIARLALMGEDARTRFKGKPGTRKAIAWADPVSLAEMKAIGRVHDASINDVVMSSVAGALSLYLRDKRDKVAGKTVRALVPVNLRPMERAGELGNRFGLVFVDLPLGIDDPIERLATMRATMRALRESKQPVLSLGLLAAMGSGPRVLQEVLLGALARKASAVLTNVPGPQQPLYLAGARIDQLMFWVPQSGDIGLGISVISYNGGVQIGVMTDHGFCPDPGRVAAHFSDAFETLVLATLMEMP